MIFEDVAVVVTYSIPYCNIVRRSYIGFGYVFESSCKVLSPFKKTVSPFKKGEGVLRLNLSRKMQIFALSEDTVYHGDTLCTVLLSI